MPTTMNLIAKQTVGAGGAASVTFSSIPDSFTDLKLVMSARGSGSGTRQNVLIQLNSSGSSFTWLGLYAFNTSVQSNTTSNNFAGNIPNSGNTANTFGTQDIYIPNYRSNNAKTLSTDFAVENNGTDNFLGFDATLWNPGTQAAITSITLSIASSGDFVEFSEFTLYGISSNTTTQNTTTPSAIGGDVITTDGTYWYHQFLYSGTFTPLKNLTCDYLVVAGGGGGGGGPQPGAGGGGAGGYRTSIGGTALSLTVSTAYAATVGAGGTGGTASSGSATGVQGSSSIFSTITSTGGGGGAGSINTDTVTSGSGGSGGGGARPLTSPGSMSGGAGNTPSTSPSQGNNGGSGFHNPGVASLGGGGGGASAVGGNAGGSTAGAGGNGTANSITGSSVTYAGGGGGGADTGNNGAGGTGGGGAGGLTGVAGTANRGGGGGGSANYSSTGGRGGSGIIVVRYAV
jgi:hypothetical protein